MSIEFSQIEVFFLHQGCKLVKLQIYSSIENKNICVKRRLLSQNLRLSFLKKNFSEKDRENIMDGDFPIPYLQGYQQLLSLDSFSQMKIAD